MIAVVILAAALHMSGNVYEGLNDDRLEALLAGVRRRHSMLHWPVSPKATPLGSADSMQSECAVF